MGKKRTHQNTPPVPRRAVTPEEREKEHRREQLHRAEHRLRNSRQGRRLCEEEHRARMKDMYYGYGFYPAPFLLKGTGENAHCTDWPKGNLYRFNKKRSQRAVRNEPDLKMKGHAYRRVFDLWHETF